jgi:hypothetical protein
MNQTMWISGKLKLSSSSAEFFSHHAADHVFQGFWTFIDVRS